MSKKILPVDLNEDGQCEYFVTWNWGRRCTPVTTIVKSDGGTFREVGEHQGASVEAFAEKRNGYYRLVISTWGGPRANTIYTASVLYFDGKSYKCEFCKKNSHGGYMDLAKEAYDKGDFKLSEIYYWNAYSINGERKLSDANNLSLVYIRQRKHKEAISLLESHLSFSDEKIKEEEAYPCYLNHCMPSDERLVKLKSAALFNKRLAVKNKEKQR